MRRNVQVPLANGCWAILYRQVPTLIYSSLFPSITLVVYKSHGFVLQICFRFSISTAFQPFFYFCPVKNDILSFLVKWYFSCTRPTIDGLFCRVSRQKIYEISYIEPLLFFTLLWWYQFVHLITQLIKFGIHDSQYLRHVIKRDVFLLHIYQYLFLCAKVHLRLCGNTWGFVGI